MGNKKASNRIKAFCVVTCLFAVYQCISVLFTSEVFWSRRPDWKVDVKNKPCKGPSVTAQHRYQDAPPEHNYKKYPIGWNPNCKSTVPIIESEEELLREPVSQMEDTRADNKTIFFVSYADEKFLYSGLRIAKEAIQFQRFSKVTVYKPENISLVFKGVFRNVW